jgi:DNA primase catalytic core
MKWISEQEVARLKAEFPLTRLCEHYGLPLEKHGKDLAARCPFHEDGTPSFIVTPEKNLWNCLAGCGGGSVVDLVMRMEKIAFRRAVERLLEMEGKTPAVASVTTKSGKQYASLVGDGEELSDAQLLLRVVDFYHQTFMNQPAAMQYLQKRGCFHPEAAKQFKLGYANRTLAYRLPPEQLAAGKVLRERLQRLGILRESGHEHLTGCVVFPVLTPAPDGPAIGEIYGRRVTQPVRNASPHLYLPGKHSGVWNAAGLHGKREWLLCEAALDALSLYVHGFEAVTWSYGVRGFTPDHWELLKACRPDRVTIGYDNDEAGNTAANELAHQLEAAGVEAWRVEWPRESDVNDLVRQSKDAKGDLASCFAKSHRLLPSNVVGAIPVVPLAVPSEPQAVAPDPTPPVAMVWDDLLDQPLPVVTRESLETGVGWTREPATPAPLPVELPAPGVEPAKHGANGPPAPSGAVGAGPACLRMLPEGVAEMTLSEGEPHGPRTYRVRGLSSNTSFDALKVNLRLIRHDALHVDTLDLYQARARTSFAAVAAQITGLEKPVIEADLGKLLVRVEAHQQQQIIEKMKATAPGAPGMTPEEEMKALALLREPKLLERIVADFALAGTVGEDTNKLLGYLIAISRKLDDPLSGLIVARSAAGKSALLNAILDFVPDEDKETLTAMTTQALFYLPENGLKHKVLAVVEDEGSQSAAYPLKILQSEKKLVLAVTVKDPEGGLPRTQLKTVEGPVAQFMTSTQAEFDEELANRFLVLSVDEESGQTQRIHDAQRQGETLRGLLAKLDRADVLKTHHAAQRLLRPLQVVIPFAETLHFPSDRLRLRRDHKKYLGLIRTIAFLRQFQKPVKSCEHRGRVVQYIEADPEDLRQAEQLAGPVMGRSLDELAPPTRAFLLVLQALVQRLATEQKIKPDRVRLTRREMREHLKWGEAQVRRHLERLVNLEYALCHRVPGTAARFTYELTGHGPEPDAVARPGYDGKSSP